MARDRAARACSALAAHWQRLHLMCQRSIAHAYKRRERVCRSTVATRMDIRAELHSTYRETFGCTGDRTQAFLEAGRRFADLAGYVPQAATLNRLLHGAVLGTRHPLMRLLEQPPATAQPLHGDRPARGLRLRSN